MAFRRPVPHHRWSSVYWLFCQLQLSEFVSQPAISNIKLFRLALDPHLYPHVAVVSHFKANQCEPTRTPCDTIAWDGAQCVGNRRRLSSHHVPFCLFVGPQCSRLTICDWAYVIKSCLSWCGCHKSSCLPMTRCEVLWCISSAYPALANGFSILWQLDGASRWMKYFNIRYICVPTPRVFITWLGDVVKCLNA